MYIKRLLWHASSEVGSREYESLAQQCENCLRWPNGSRKEGVKQSQWKVPNHTGSRYNNILEMSELNAIVVNACHMKAVPGRKTDVSDAE